MIEDGKKEETGKKESKTARERSQIPLKKTAKERTERKSSGRRGKEIEKEEEGKVQKSEMVEEMQRAHHKLAFDGNEARPTEEGR